jgi:hypothetical protein
VGKGAPRQPAGLGGAGVPRSTGPGVRPPGPLPALSPALFAGSPKQASINPPSLTQAPLWPI